MLQFTNATTSSKHTPITWMNVTRHIYIHRVCWLNSQKTANGSNGSIRGSRTCRDNAVSTVPPRTAKFKVHRFWNYISHNSTQKLMYEWKHWTACLRFAERYNRRDTWTLKTLKKQARQQSFRNWTFCTIANIHRKLYTVYKK
jgi:hypothetical protein